jgi:hypothetical protein
LRKRIRSRPEIPQTIDGALGRLVAGGLTAHAVGHGQQPLPLVIGSDQETVLIIGPFEAFMGK